MAYSATTASGTNRGSRFWTASNTSVVELAVRDRNRETVLPSAARRVGVGDVPHARQRRTLVHTCVGHALDHVDRTKSDKSARQIDSNWASARSGSSASTRSTTLAGSALGS